MTQSVESKGQHPRNENGIPSGAKTFLNVSDHWSVRSPSSRIVTARVTGKTSYFIGKAMMEPIETPAG